MPPRSYIEAIDRPSVIHVIINTMVSAQQTILLPENASQRHTDEPQSGRNSCLWLFYPLLDDWGGDHWLPLIGLRVPVAMAHFLLTCSGGVISSDYCHLSFSYLPCHNLFPSLNLATQLIWLHMYA